MTESSNLVLSVTNTVSDDVRRGLMLYGVENGILTAQDEARAGRWMSLFEANPVGSGLFAMAKHQDELVGFIALIDIEMQIGGTVRKGGKAEFWVVRPDYRKIFPSGSTTRLPWTLFHLLRTEAASHGYDVVLTVSRLAARHLHRSGDLCIPTELAGFTAIDDCDLAARLGAASGEHTAAVREIVVLDAPVASPADALVASTPAMINWRFPSGRYRKFLLLRGAQAPLLFVFHTPKPGEPATLVHWSGLPETSAELAAVLARAAVGEAGIKLEIPAIQVADSDGLTALGFIPSARALSDCFLMAANPALDLAEIRRWHVTHGHMRYYSSIT